MDKVFDYRVEGSVMSFIHHKGITFCSVKMPVLYFTLINIDCVQTLNNDTNMQRIINMCGIEM